jgi:hypothetical protein
VNLHLDVHDIHMVQDNDIWTGALQTAFLQLDKRGEIIQGLGQWSITLRAFLPGEFPA